jgi:hypothetical protein
MLTATFIAVVTWSTFAIGSAVQHGRRSGRLQRIAGAIAVVGFMLGMMTPMLVTYGSPTGRLFQWVFVSARVSEFGLIVAVVGAATWVLMDTAFVWFHRRQVFPFAFRGGPGGEG